MELKEGEYVIPEGYTVKRVGRTIQIYKTLKKTLSDGDLRCKDCQYFIRGHSVSYYTTEVCKMKPKKEKNGVQYYFAANKYNMPCSNFKKRDDGNKEA